MRYEEFIEEIKKHIKEYLPEEWQAAKVMPQKETKNNGINQYGITIQKPGASLAPLLSLKEFYQLHSHGANMEYILSKIGKEYLEAARTAPDFETPELSYENMRSGLILCAVNAEKNKELLSSVPHQRVEDLAIVYRCIMIAEGDRIGSVLVNNEHLRLWGIRTDVLHEHAKNNMEKVFPYELHTMDYIMSDMMGIPFEESRDSMENSLMFVLSNNKKWQGASYLFCPEVLEAVSKELGGSFLILPSSIHELILIRQREDSNIQVLRDMVCEVNQTQVIPEERLSNEIYQYDAENRKMSMVSDGEIQQGMHFEM